MNTHTPREAAPLIRAGIFKGVDMQALARRLWKMEAMSVEDGRPLPTIRWRAGSHSGTGGRGGRARVTMNVGLHSTLENVAEVLVHELVHSSRAIAFRRVTSLGTPIARRLRRDSHGDGFKVRLIACFREAFGLELDTAALLALPAGHHKCSAYAIDEFVRKAMEAAGVGARLLADPTLQRALPTIPSRAERAAAAADQRAAHAKKMLAAWEKRAKAAKRLQAKWAAKVAYYDRRERLAAKPAGSP